MVRCKITKCVTTLILLFIVPIISINTSSVGGKEKILNVVTTAGLRDARTTTKEEIRNSLITSVTNYISEKYGKNKAVASSFVDYGIKNHIDICFMLAQAEIETCFGKTGTGRSHKKSMFGVTSRKYPTYDKCVKDFCDLLRKSYLTNGKTEHHLMKNYISKGGHRYCDDFNYEKVLTRKYNDICNTTNIHTLQVKYNKLT